MCSFENSWLSHGRLTGINCSRTQSNKNTRDLLGFLICIFSELIYNIGSSLINQGLHVSINPLLFVDIETTGHDPLKLVNGQIVPWHEIIDFAALFVGP